MATLTDSPRRTLVFSCVQRAAFDPVLEGDGSVLAAGAA